MNANSPGSLQRKSGIAAPLVYRPVNAPAAAPAVYRPGVVAPLQRKPGIAAPLVYRPVNAAAAAPAVYRPNVVAPLQRKQSSATSHDYRPQTAVARQTTFGGPIASSFPPPGAQGRGMNPDLKQHTTPPQRMAQPRIAGSQGPVAQCHGNGDAFRLPAAHISRRLTTTANAVQRMQSDPWKSLQKGLVDFALTTVTAVGSAIFKYPNPIEMQNFTSCVCLVFNAAGKQNRDYKSNTSREVVFESIKNNWDAHHATGTFFDVCPYDENDNLTTEWSQLMLNDAGSGIFGNRPLVVIIGHCGPGSDKIENDDGKKYKISDVITAIRPALKSRCAIYLTPCNTGVASDSSPSFQTQFTNEMIKEATSHGELQRNSESLIIGTTSVSVPAKGKVLTTGQTYSRVKVKNGGISRAGDIEEAKFLHRQNQ